jgi:hypothetical protein
VAWLLRTNRLYGPDRELAAGRTFARAFGGGCADRAVDAAQVARWELVAARADYRTIRRYEELLGLPDHRLTVLADTVYREARGTPGRRAAPGDPLHPGATWYRRRFRRGHWPAERAK